MSSDSERRNQKDRVHQVDEELSRIDNEIVIPIERPIARTTNR